ncbi:cytochrome c oxidase subunit III domain-containing protein [Lactarius akahatsu]|uniref:Cytochrome c oxidase subunit 3 n=1 Tax=Lactarius akahatsu TaxID=416441 RepID=A0AAD4LTY5_9AGAM|nr:cytochrome c oxidase subunit III domain-containing protein [Lactarius akahatsu]
MTALLPLSRKETSRSRFVSAPVRLVSQLAGALLLHHLTLGAVMYMQGFTHGGQLLSLGFTLTVFDIITEVQKGLTIGVVLFIIMYFELSSILVYLQQYRRSMTTTRYYTIRSFVIPLLNTVLLLSSGAFVTYGDRKGSILGTLLKIIFAIIFTALQSYEYSESSLTMSDSVYGTVFYATTGLHGLHVIIGYIIYFRHEAAILY